MKGEKEEKEERKRLVSSLWRLLASHSNNVGKLSVKVIGVRPTVLSRI